MTNRRRDLGWSIAAFLPRNSGSVPSGTTTSKAFPTSSPKNSGGVTPTIVNGIPSTASVVPMMPADPPKRRCHSP
jgi:hypothetical protein